MYFSFNNEFPLSIENMPERIRLADGSTIYFYDLSTVSKEVLEAAGWKMVPDPPDYDKNLTKLVWEPNPDPSKQGEYKWAVYGIPLEEKANQIRHQRNLLMNQFMWRIYRYQRESRLGVPLSDDIRLLDEYMQKLADISKQETFPRFVEWPEIPPESTTKM